MPEITRILARDDREKRVRGTDPMIADLAEFGFKLLDISLS